MSMFVRARGLDKMIVHVWRENFVLYSKHSLSDALEYVLKNPLYSIKKKNIRLFCVSPSQHPTYPQFSLHHLLHNCFGRSLQNPLQKFTQHKKSAEHFESFQISLEPGEVKFKPAFEPSTQCTDLLLGRPGVAQSGVQRECYFRLLDAVGHRSPLASKRCHVGPALFVTCFQRSVWLWVPFQCHRKPPRGREAGASCACRPVRPLGTCWPVLTSTKCDSVIVKTL